MGVVRLTMTIWVDVGDLLYFATDHATPSGIQRVGFELALAMAVSPRVAFCAAAGGTAGGFWSVGLEVVTSAYAALRSGKHPESNASQWFLEEAPADFVCGDILLLLSPPSGAWEYISLIQDVATRCGVRVTMFIHDIIPILYPQWCEERVVRDFERWHQAIMPWIDTILTSSLTVAADVTAWATRCSLRLVRPVQVVRLGSRFCGTDDPRPVVLPLGVDASPAPGFALFVSTIEPRKNHALAITVWRRLVTTLGPNRVPQLICAGRIGWLLEDLTQDCNDLDGKILLLHGVNDEQLSRLYTSCRFTFFPSYYEGWGLPITESLAFGKLCAASNSGAIPEAGGDLCLYFDPGRPEEAAETIIAMLELPGLLQVLTDRVRAEFREVGWHDSAQQVLSAIVSPKTGKY
jgi:glycosyltransferase involved in cell wall biosynthesis